MPWCFDRAAYVLGSVDSRPSASARLAASILKEQRSGNKALTKRNNVDDKCNVSAAKLGRSPAKFMASRRNSRNASH